MDIPLMSPEVRDDADTSDSAQHIIIVVCVCVIRPFPSLLYKDNVKL